MKRRTFIGTLGAAAAAIAIPGRLRAAPPLEHIGLELYSVRNSMRANPEATMAAVRAIGYTDVELLWSFQNFGRTPQQVRATLDHEGLRAPSAHMEAETILKDWDRSLDTAALLGHQYLIVPSLPGEVKTSLDAWRRWADRFNTAGTAARKHNLWLAFHNEADHMTPIDGVVPYDMFVGLLDPAAVRLQLDTGNMFMGGGDPMRYLDRYADRYWSFHVKDVVADRSSDTELGTGVLDLPKFLRAVRDLPQKPLYVEQEGATDELAAMRRDFDYLHGLNL